MIRVIHDQFGKSEYPNENEKKQMENLAIDYGLEHWGQMKLLMSEIEFLTPFKDKPIRRDNFSFAVIYAGASPGTHIPILVELFPRFKYILVDPCPSFIGNREYRNIEIMQQFMDNNLAEDLHRQYKDMILFISDIRTPPPNEGKTENKIDHQKRIERDMNSQKEWYKILQPECSMFKFRLPWTTDVFGSTTEYMDGKIHLQVYSRIFSHETRLIVGKDAPMKQYDNTLYEMRMVYFNSIVRISGLIERGNHYDRMASRDIIQKYLTFNETFEENANRFLPNRHNGIMEEIAARVFIGIYKCLTNLCTNTKI
jgi:Poly A polymerase regulatory subunit